MEYTEIRLKCFMNSLSIIFIEILIKIQNNFIEYLTNIRSSLVHNFHCYVISEIFRIFQSLAYSTRISVLKPYIYTRCSGCCECHCASIKIIVCDTHLATDIDRLRFLKTKSIAIACMSLTFLLSQIIHGKRFTL